MPPHHDHPLPPPHHHGPHHGEAPPPPPPKPHWARMEQMPDEHVLRYAPPEIRRLWRKMTSLEESLEALQEQNRAILQALQRLEKEREAGA